MEDGGPNVAVAVAVLLHQKRERELKKHTAAAEARSNKKGGQETEGLPRPADRRRRGSPDGGQQRPFYRLVELLRNWFMYLIEKKTWQRQI